MANYEHCLLTDRLFQIRKTDGCETFCSLPEVLASMTRNEIEAFTALQKHQQHSWHAFLVQLAVITLHQNDLSRCENTEDWEKMLLVATQNSYEAWSLVVTDLKNPAFMQPPVAENSLKEFKTVGTSPDLIDLLITAKNHDLKIERIVSPSPSHWLYSLISLQSMQGFLGSGNYGIARMNGGFGSRPCATYRSSHLPGQIFIDDVEKCLSARNLILELYEHYRSSGGLSLLWLETWDGTTQLEMNQLDPFFIEICRRIRLTQMSGKITALVKPTKVARIIAKELNGCTGDPWTPVDSEKQKALTLSSKGFDYQLSQEIIFGKGYKTGATQKILNSSKDAFFWGSALVRGQGVTEGYCERKIKIPAKARKLMMSAAERDKLGERSQKWINSVVLVRKNVLWPALAKLSTERAPQFSDMFVQKVDQIYFQHFWAEIDSAEEGANRAWENELLKIAEKILQLAIDRTPMKSTSYYRTSCEAEGLFNGCKRKHLPHLFIKEGTDGTNRISE